MKRLKEIDLTRIHEVVNPKFYPLLFDENEILILRGGRGSGKSKFWAQKIVYRILEGYNDVKHTFLVLRKTTANCNRSVVREIKEVLAEWGLNGHFIYNSTEKIFKFPNGSEIHCLGIDDPEKIKSVKGVTGLVVEEATEFSRDDIISLIASMRGIINTYYQTILAFNPISINNYIYKMFFMNVYPDATYHHSTYRDNPYLDDKYIGRLEALVGQDDNARKILIDGEWGVLEGLIYTNWKVIEEWPEDDIEGDIIYGLDFGFNHPEVLVRVAEYKDGYVIDELYYETGRTTGHLIEQLPNLIHSRLAEIYCDSARPDLIEEIFLADWNAQPADKRPGSVKDGIDFCKRKPLYITDRSSGIKKELPVYSWKQDKDGNYLDEPVKLFDDGCDAFRYPIFTYFHNQYANTLTVFK